VDLDALLLRQAGVVTLQQAVAAGMSARTVQRRVASGAWRALHPRVYLAGGHRLTDEARIRAAALWCGDHATVSGVAAAYWHGMIPRAAGLVDVTLPRSVRLEPGRGVLPHRRDLSPEDRIDVRGLWVTAPPLTVLQAATELVDGSTFLDRALQRHVHIDGLRTAHSRNLGRRGSTRAGRLLAAAVHGAESAAERLLVKHLRRAGITGWVLGHPLGPHRIDLRSRPPASPSRWTAGRGTPIRPGSPPTATRATRSPGPAGISCGSPGTTSMAALRPASGRSTTCSPAPPHDRRPRRRRVPRDTSGPQPTITASGCDGLLRPERTRSGCRAAA
jgi:hypothetical protein